MGDMKKHPGGGKRVWYQGRAAGHHTAAHFRLLLSPHGPPNATVVTEGKSWEPEKRVCGLGTCVHKRGRERDRERWGFNGRD